MGVVLSIATAVDASDAAAAAATVVATKPDCRSEAADIGAASGLAIQCGAPVEVLDARTENTQVFANPSGSFTTVMNTQPQRVKRSDGSWTPVDTTLRRLSDGTLVAKAAVARVVLGGGGDQPLARFGVSGGEVSYRWEGRLPVPVLDGDTAVYPEVYPGVDLRATALADGFTYALVVKSRAAAANPALRQLRLKVQGARLTVRPKAGDGFEAVTADGTVAVTSGEASMWDSRGADTSDAARRANPREHVFAAAPDHARTKNLTARLTDGVLAVDTDAAMLADPATVFPVVIDPSSKTVAMWYWGYGNSINASRSDSIARVGLNPDGGTWRSYFTFNLNAVTTGPTNVISAAFQTYLTHSWACGNTPVSLYAIGSHTSGRNTWAAPALSTHLGEGWGHAHKVVNNDPECTDDPQPDAFMEWKNGSTQSYVQGAFNSAASQISFALSNRRSDGTSEGTGNYWKKFDPNRTTLAVEWNKTPTTPVATDLSTASSGTAADIPCSGVPFVRSTTPVLRAKLRDPDNEAGGSLTGEFTWQSYNGTAWVAGGTLSDASPPATPSAPNNIATVQLPTLSQAGHYRWQVRTTDSQPSSSLFSPWCEFVVSAQPPAQMPTVVSADNVYKEKSVNPAAQGAVGKTGSFTFTPNGAAGVTAFTYWLTGGAAHTVPVVSGSATVRVTPPAVGENVLHVMSRDAAGNSSEDYNYRFVVAAAAAEVVRWNFDESSGTTAAGTGSAPVSATLINSAHFNTGRYPGANGADRALTLDGADDWAESAKVLDTRQAFTISAWAYINAAPAAESAIASQVGLNQAAIELLAVPGAANGWCVAAYTADQVASARSTACAGAAAPIVPHSWTQLTAVYDPDATPQLSLYVNGTQVAQAAKAITWDATDKFAIGRSRTGGPSDFFGGRISDVRVWQRAINPDTELHADLMPPAVGNWTFEDSIGTAPTVAADSTNRANTLNFPQDPTVYESPARWDVEDLQFTYGVRFDGLAGQVIAAGPVIHTGHSFTVATWIQLDGDPANDDPSGKQTAISIDNPSGRSGFALRYQTASGGQWSFKIPDSPTVEAGTQVTAPAPDPTTWHHIAGVYNNDAKTITLYVDGVVAATAAMTAQHVPWSATGSLVLGREKYLGTSMGWFGGMLDDTQSYASALTTAQMSALYNRSALTRPNQAPPVPTNQKIGTQSCTSGRVAPTSVTATLAADLAANAGEIEPLRLQARLVGGETTYLTTEGPFGGAGTHTLNWPTVTDGSWPAQLAGGAVYKYQVRSYDGRSYSAWSTGCELQVTTTATPTNPPAVTVSQAANGSYTLTITPAAGDSAKVYAYRYGTDPRALTSLVTVGTDMSAKIVLRPNDPTNLHLQALNEQQAANPMGADGRPQTTVVALAAVAAPVASKKEDVNGDGLGDIVGLRDQGNGYSVLYESTTTATGTGSPVLPISDEAFPTATTAALTGDLDGDKRADIVLFTDTGVASNVGVRVLRSTGAGYVSSNLSLTVPAGTPVMPRSKVKPLVADFTGDGKDDIALVFNNTGNSWQAWVWKASGTAGNATFAQGKLWVSGTPYWASSHFVAGKFRGADGRYDLMYVVENPGCAAAAYAHQSNVDETFAAGFILWTVPGGGWCTAVSKISVADMDGNGVSEFLGLYDHGNCSTTIYRFSPNGDGTYAQNGLWGSGGIGTWCPNVGTSGLHTGDVTGDGKDDITWAYECCGKAQTRIWRMSATGAGSTIVAPVLTWEGAIATPDVGSVVIDTTKRYQLINQYSNKCLTVPGASTGDAIQLEQQTCSDTALNMSFKIVRTGGGQHVLQPAHVTGKCVDASGDNVIVYQLGCNGLLHQIFVLEYQSGLTNAVVVKPQSVYNGKCMDIVGPSTAENAKVHQWTCYSTTSQLYRLRLVP